MAFGPIEKNRNEMEKMKFDIFNFFTFFRKGATTLDLMTFSKLALNLFGIMDRCIASNGIMLCVVYAKCHVLIAMQSVLMLVVVMLMALNLLGIIETLSIKCRCIASNGVMLCVVYAKCRVFIAMLSVLMLVVVIGTKPIGYNCDTEHNAQMYSIK